MEKQKKKTKRGSEATSEAVGQNEKGKTKKKKQERFGGTVSSCAPHSKQIGKKTKQIEVPMLGGDR